MNKFSMHEVEAKAKELADWIVKREQKPVKLYGIPRGGVPAVLAVARYIPFCDIVDHPSKADYLIDDLIDSGATMERWCDKYPGKPFVALHTKQPYDDWVVFPWEHTKKQSAEDIPTRLLQYIGEDVKRGGLQETPARFLRAWGHYTSGYDADIGGILKTFEDGAEGVDELVLIKNIPLYSQCEHHLAPFFGVAHVGYIPKKKIVGLSKLSRVVDAFARRLQVQERLTQQVANALEYNLEPVGVGVVLECRHMCMESRGIAQQGHVTVTSAMRGALKEKISARAEFLQLIKGE